MDKRKWVTGVKQTSTYRSYNAVYTDFCWAHLVASQSKEWYWNNRTTVYRNKTIGHPTQTRVTPSYHYYTEQIGVLWCTQNLKSRELPMSSHPSWIIMFACGFCHPIPMIKCFAFSKPHLRLKKNIIWLGKFQKSTSKPEFSLHFGKDSTILKKNIWPRSPRSRTKICPTKNSKSQNRRMTHE